MKKKLLFATIILVLLAGILYYISLPDYLVFNSMSFSNGANRDTELQVIVYQYWNTDEVIAEIEAEHNQINGTPTILTINLYHSKWSFRNGYEPFYVSAKYCYAAHESRLHQNDRCKRFALCLVLTVRFRSLAPWGKLFQLFI